MLSEKTEEKHKIKTTVDIHFNLNSTPDQILAWQKTKKKF
jgi:hypothetical protein